MIQRKVGGKKMQKRKAFTTFDIVLMALLAVANAVLTVYIAYLNKTLTAIGGPIATSVTVGIYILYGLLAIYIIRKPGTGFITFMLGATVQTLFGISYGMVAAYGAALCYAIAMEGVYALYRYRNWGYMPVIWASVAATIVWFPLAAYLFGYLKWGTPILLASLLIRCLSGVLLCGLLAKWIGDGLLKTGLLRFYAAGRKLR